MAEGTKLITHRDLIQLMLDRMIEVHKLLKTQKLKASPRRRIERRRVRG